MGSTKTLLDSSFQPHPQKFYWVSDQVRDLHSISAREDGQRFELSDSDPREIILCSHRKAKALISVF